MTMTLTAHRPIRFAAIILAGVALACAGAYALLTLTYPPARVTALIAAETHAATGRELRIDGGLSYRLLPTLAVVAKDVALGNAPGGTRPDMATIRRISFEIALRPLLSGEFHVRQLTLEGADIHLESDAQGNGNWRFAEPATAPDKAEGSAPVIDLRELIIRDARIGYRDGDRETRLTIETLELLRAANGLGLAARLLAGAQSWQLEGDFGRPADLFAGIADWPFALRAETAGARLSVSGSAGTGSHAPAMRGKFSATFDDATALAPIAGNFANLPMPLVVTATLERTAAALEADPLWISLAGQEVAGRIALREQDGEREIAGELSSSLIDLTRSPAGHPRPAQPENAGGPLFADVPLPFAALPAISTHIRFTADRLLLPDLPALSAVSGVVRSGPGRFVLEPFVFALGDGQVASRLEISRAAGGIPQTLLAVDARGLPVDTVARSIRSGHMIRDGRIDLHANLTLRGATPRAMASSSTGSFLVSVRNATLAQGAALEQNILRTLLQAIMPGRQPSDRLEITCAVLGLPLKEGVARIDRSIAFETKDLAVLASGEVNLARETLTLVFEQQAKKGMRLGEVSLAQLVMLKGPLRDPKVGIDPKGAAQEAATLGIAVATGGLSLLAGRVLSERERTDACRFATAAARPAEHTGQRGKGEVADPRATFFKR